jgi:hypothetical protein
MAQAEAEYPRLAEQCLTDPVKGLGELQRAVNNLTSANGTMKVFCQVAEL